MLPEDTARAVKQFEDEFGEIEHIDPFAIGPHWAIGLKDDGIILARPSSDDSDFEFAGLGLETARIWANDKLGLGPIMPD